MFLKKLTKHTNTFGFRLTAAIVVLLAFTSMLVFAVSHHVMSSTLRAHDDEELFDEMSEYSNEYKSNGVSGVSRKAGFEVRSDGTLMLIVRLVNGHGALLFTNEKIEPLRGDFDRFSSEPIEKDKIIRIVDSPMGGDLEVLRKSLLDGNELQIAHTSVEREELLRETRTLFASLFLPVLLLSGLCGLFLSSRVLRPVRSLISLLQSILLTGRFDVRAPVRGTEDELDSLSGLFNSLLERISLVVATMKNSLDNVAHDLRTPMARFRGTAELILCDNSEISAREGIVSAIEESDRILTTLSTLMDISEAEAGAMKLNIQSSSLQSIVERVISLYETVAEDSEITVTSLVPDDVQIDVDPDRTAQVLANLLDNALKFTPAGGSVRIAAVRTDNMVEVSVADSGMGIEEQDIPHIFERLYRGDRSRSSRGFGLGLSLVRAVVAAHGGRIQVQSKVNSGTTFRIMIPDPPRL